MSAGIFEIARYEADYGDGTAIHPIKIQPETESLVVGTATNDRPAGSITNPISAVISRGKRQSGLRPRTITIKTPNTSPPTGYKPGSLITLPALNKDVWEAAVRGETCSYLGLTTFVVAGRSREEAK
jgi:hypothetical protein